MTLSVIGSGFGRTGTMSLKIALEQLGLGPCHHMEEVMDNPGQLEHWRSAARGESVDWEKVFEGYGSAVDWPGAHFWRELAAAYPDANVVHTTRTVESWWASFSKTIAMVLSQAGPKGPVNDMETIPEMAHEIVAAQTFGGRHEDKQTAMEEFEKRERDVISSIDADRLLVFDVRQGWEPLCDFLELPVPEGPFPRSNDQDAFWELVKKMGSDDL